MTDQFLLITPEVPAWQAMRAVVVRLSTGLPKGYVQNIEHGIGRPERDKFRGSFKGPISG
jgi:hypothetical protein